MNILSEYHGANSIRQAMIYRNEYGFFVRHIENDIVMNTKFISEQQAEIFAENWVLGEKDE